MNNMWKRSLSMVLALVMVLGMVPFGALRAAAAEVGDTTTTSTKTPPADVPYGIWVLDEGTTLNPNPKTICGKAEHTHSDSCYRKNCDHADGHLSTCYSSSTSYALCECDKENPAHTGSVTLTDVVTISGTNVSWKTEHPAYSAVHAVYYAAYKQAYDNANWGKEYAGKVAGVAALAGKEFCYTVSSSAEPDLCTHTCSAVGGSCYMKICVYSEEHTHDPAEGGCYEYRWTLQADVNDNGILDTQETPYTITYVANGATFATLTALEGVATPTPVSNPTRTYYTFAGWSPAVAATVTGDATYEATWKPIKDADDDGIADEEDTFTISWDTDGDGDVDTTTELKYGTNPADHAPAHAEKEDHYANGWSPAFENVTKAATYTAQYSKDTIYTIIFKVDGEEYETQLVNVTDGEKVAAVAAPDKAYAVFGGWTNSDVIGTVPTGDVTLEAQWLSDANNNNVVDADETATIQVTITGNGSVTLNSDSAILTNNGDGTYTVVYDSTVEGGNAIGVTATPADTDGTDGSADYLVSAPTTVTVADGKTATVKAEFATESITVNDEGDVFFNGYKVTEKLDGLKEKVLDAALGEGTYNAGDYTVYMVTGSGTYDVETDNVLERIAMSGVFNIGDAQNFVVQKNGNTVVSDTIKINVKDSRLVLSISVKDVSISGKTEPADVAQQVKNAVTITATDPQTEAVTVVVVSDSYLSYDPTYVWPEDAQTGTFTVTVRVNTMANATYSNAPSATLTLTCTDTTILYNVTYTDGLGNELYSDEIAENTATPAIDDPTRTYYTFAGWMPNVAATVTADASYAATWTPVTDNNGNDIADEEETYTVIYAPGYEGAATLATFTDLAWGSATPTITNPTREGYNFLGWDVTPAAAVSAPAEGNTITYTALWTELHAVIFIDRETQTSFEIKDGDTVAEPATPTWDEEHDFLGWYNGDKLYDFASPVTGSLTLNAKWREDYNHNDIEDATEAHYTVTYVVDGEETKFENLLVDTATPTVDDPTMENFKFAGWDPEVAGTVTADATYTAQWLNDINNNDVDDALETITIVVNTAAETDAVTVNGEAVATYVYDSTTGETVVIDAAPTTHLDNSTHISDTFVAGIDVDGTAVAVTYSITYHGSYDLVLAPAAGSKTVTVTFAPAVFTWNDERIMNYYDGMTGIQTKDIYDVVASEPPFDGATEVTVQYKAREAMSHTVYIDQLNINDLTKTVLKLINGNSNEFVINMDTLWMDANDRVQESVSLQQAVEAYFTSESIQKVFDAYTNAGGFAGGSASLNAAKAELAKIYNAITAAAMYYGAHNFGYNNTDSETVDELLRITYKNDAMYIVAEQTITLKDLREASYVKGNNVSLMYKDYTDEDLVAAIAAYAADANGNAIAGATVYSVEIQDPYTFEGRNVSETAYEITMKFAGNETYKPSQAVFTVTITKAPASMDAPNVNVYYGTDYSLLPSVTLGNAYGASTDITDSMIQFIVGLDVADLDVNADGVTGLNGAVQLILPKDLQDMLDLVAGGDSTGLTMSLSQLVEYLGLLEDSSVDALEGALGAITKITEAGDIQITIGGALPTDIGVYLHGAVSTNSNYETAFDAGYLIIKPNATQVYLDFNYHDENGIFTKDLLSRIDLGASAYDDQAFETLNPDATALVQNLFFGVDANGELITSMDAAALGTGAYTQLAFIAEFGNNFYYAIPIVRPVVIVPNVSNVELVDADGNAKDEYTFTFDNTAKSLYAKVDGKIVDAEILYYGIQTNTKIHKAEDGAPVHAGAYTATVTYVTYDEKGEILSVGADMAVITIVPTESDISVTGGSVVYDGQGHGATVKTSSAVEGLTPDVTIISGTVLVDGDKDGIGLADIQGVANVDFPKWLDDILSKRFEGAYATGVTVKDFSYKLEQYTDKLLELGVTEEMINSVQNLLSNLPENVTLTFNDNVTYTEVGAYFFLGVVTDSDHKPSMDTGLLLIQKKDMAFDLKDTTVTYDGEEHFVDVTNPNNSDYVYVMIDRENNVGNIVLEDDLNALVDALEKELGRELPDSVDVAELLSAVNTILDKLEGYEDMPVLAESVLTKLREVLAQLPQSGTIYLNGSNPVDVGTYEFYAITYSLEYATEVSRGTLEILPIEIKVEVDSVSKVYGDADPELTYQVVDTEGNEVSGVAEVTLTRTEGEDVGKYPITAEVTVTNKNYKLISVTEDAELTITPYAVTITVADATKVYGDADPEFTHDCTVDELDITITREAGENVGEYAIHATVADNDNYTVTVVPGKLTITPAKATVVVDAQTKVYGESDPELTYTASSDELKVTVERKAGENVGTYDITATVEENANFDVEITNAVLTITPAKATVVVDAQTKVYGESDPELTYTASSDELKVTVERKAGENVGTYDITATVEENANFDVEITNAALTITPAKATVVVDAQTKVYGETDPELTYTASSDELKVTVERKVGENVGTYDIIATVAENPNFTVEVTNAKLTITPKAVTITAADATKVYGDADPALTTDCEIAELNAKAVREEGENVGEYKITVTCTENANYNVTTEDGTFTITPAKATVVVDAQTKVYGETDPKLTYTASSDELKVTVERKAGENVGTYDIIATVEENANFEVEVTNAKLTIIPAKATVVVNAQTKVYGESDPELTYTASSDELKVTVERKAGENVGTYDIIATVEDNANFDVEITNAVLTITPAKATVVVNAQTKVYGESDPELTYTASSDELKVTVEREAGENVGTYDIIATVEENANFEVEVTNAVLTIIPKAVTITAADATKVYGEADPTLTTDCEIAELNAKAVRDAGENVGEYKITVTYTENPNYTVTVADGGKLTITARTITVKLDDVTVNAGDELPTFTYTVTDGTVPEGESLKLTITTDAVDTTTPGTYTITAVDDDPNYDITVEGGATLTIAEVKDDHEGMYPIIFNPAEDDTGTIIPGGKVEVDGVPYILDEDCTAWVPHTDAKLVTTYKYKTGETHYETYPTNMYVWEVTITDTDGDGQVDEYVENRVEELDDFMLYAGTSIRINANPGIRFFTTVPADKFQDLMQGELLTGNLAGYKMVRSGTLYMKWRDENSNLILGVGVSSDVYGGGAGNNFRRFSSSNGRDWYTGMLTNLPDDPETLSMDILSRPYVILERDGQQITLYGGTVQRSVYYVATQNRDVYAEGSDFDNYIENIITTVESAKNGG